MAVAAPTVIFDNGQARPIPGIPSLPLTVPAVPQVDPAQTAQDFVGRLFPVHTPELSPGPVATQAVNLSMPTPVFLIGEDKASQDWLDRYRERLQQIQATGLVVEVSSLEAFAQLKAKAGNLPLAPVSGTELAKQLGLSHYPVLITQRVLEQ